MQLRALIICCNYENGKFFDPLDLPLPSVVDSFDIAVSSSAQEAGFLNKLSGFRHYFCATDKSKLLLQINSYDFVITFPISLNTLAKFALGLRDSFPSEVLAVAAEIGKPILLFEKVMDFVESFANPNLKRIYKNHWTNIIGGNIASFNLENLSERLVRLMRAKQNNAKIKIDGARTFITKEDIILASESLAPLKIPSNAIVTDVAKEEANLRGVVIIVE